jgi:hypothetical protein
MVPATINYSMEDRISELIQCTLEHFSLNDIKPGEQLGGSESRSLAQHEIAPGLRARFYVPSFIFATSFVAVLFLLYVLHRLGFRVPFRWLGLFYYIYTAVREQFQVEMFQMCGNERTSGGTSTALVLRIYVSLGSGRSCRGLSDIYYTAYGCDRSHRRGILGSTRGLPPTCSAMAKLRYDGYSAG